jgi:hypothetical protein
VREHPFRMPWLVRRGKRRRSGTGTRVATP